MPGPIPLNQISLMPQMGGTLSGWKQKLTLEVVSQQVVDGFPTNVYTPISFEGTVQPLSPQKIRLKPEGKWSWVWLQIHCTTTSVALKTNDRIRFAGKFYVVDGILDYNLNGYIEYHVVEDFGSVVSAPQEP